MLRNLSMCIVVLAACGGNKSDKSDKGSEKPVEAKLTFQKLGALGLEAEVPEGSSITDDSKGAGFPSATVYASPTFFVFGGDEAKPTAEDTQARLVKDEKSLQPKRNDKTADGWVIEMTGKSMMGDAITAVSVRRTIDGKAFDCKSNVKADEVAKLEKMCASIRAAK